MRLDATDYLCCLELETQSVRLWAGSRCESEEPRFLTALEKEQNTHQKILAQERNAFLNLSPI